MMGSILYVANATINSWKKMTLATSELLLADTVENDVPDNLEEVLSKSLPCDDEEVKFVCIICKHECSKVDDYDSHMKTHDESVMVKDLAFHELENLILCHVLEYQICNLDEGLVLDEMEIEEPEKHEELKFKCQLCEY